MITRISALYGPKGSVIFDHPYYADSALEDRRVQASPTAPISAIPVRSQWAVGPPSGRLPVVRVVACSGFVVDQRLAGRPKAVNIDGCSKAAMSIRRPCSKRSTVSTNG